MDPLLSICIWGIIIRLGHLTDSRTQETGLLQQDTHMQSHSVISFSFQESIPGVVPLAVLGGRVLLCDQEEGHLAPPHQRLRDKSRTHYQRASQLRPACPSYSPHPIIFSHAC